MRSPFSFPILNKLYSNISPRQRRYLGFYCLTSLVCACGEIFNLLSFSFLLNIITSDQLDINSTENIFLKFINLLNLENSNILKITFIIFVSNLVIYTCLRLLNLYQRVDLSAVIGNHISKKAFFSTINQDYSDFIKTNTSETINVLTKHSYILVAVVNAYTSLFISSCIAISIFISFFIIDFKLSISLIFLLSLIYFIIFYYSRLRLSINSKIVKNSTSIHLRTIQETLNSFRDIILYDLRENTTSNFEKSDYLMRKTEAKNAFLSSFPRYIVETIGLTILISLAVFLLVNDYEKSLILSLVGTIALGSQRLLPLLQQVYGNVAYIKGYKDSVEEVLKCLRINSLNSREVNKNFKTNLNFRKSIKLSNVSYRYPYKSDRKVIQNLNIEVIKGCNVGIFGDTGAGKSTILDILLTLLKPQEGKYLIDDIDVFENATNIKFIRSIISHVPQTTYLYDASIQENISLCEKQFIDKSRLKFVSKVSLVDQFTNNFKNGLDTKIGEKGIFLSGGQRQRISIARALYRASDFLILDEATSALDPRNESLLLKNLKNHYPELTIITVAHRYETLKNCDYWYLVKDSKAEFIENVKDFERYISLRDSRFNK